MTRRKPYRYDEEDDNEFESMPDFDEEFADDEEVCPFYEDPEELDKLIEEELGTPPRRRK